MDIKSFTNLGEQGGWAGGIIHSEKWENHKKSTHTKIKFPITLVDFFGRIIFFNFCYFINGIISTLHISSLYCCLHWYLAHSYIFFIFWYFSHLLKSTPLATPKLSPPTVFDLGGWNEHHFVGNWVAETITYHFFNIQSLSSKNLQHKKKICKKLNFLEKKNSFASQMFIIEKFEKNGTWSCAPSHGKWNKIIKFVLSVKLC